MHKSAILCILALNCFMYLHYVKSLCKLLYNTPYWKSILYMQKITEKWQETAKTVPKLNVLLRKRRNVNSQKRSANIIIRHSAFGIDIFSYSMLIIPAPLYG